MEKSEIRKGEGRGAEGAGAGEGQGAEEVGAAGCFMKDCLDRSLTFALRPGRGGLHQNDLSSAVHVVPKFDEAQEGSETVNSRRGKVFLAK